jgi:hypothetical protein
MIGVFEAEVKELKELLDLFRNFVINHNTSIECNHYYIVLGDKTFLEALEDTFYEPDLDKNLREKYVELMQVFLAKQKKIYHGICFRSDPESLALKTKFEESLMCLGFSEDGRQMFINFENTVNRISKKETTL